MSNLNRDSPGTRPSPRKAITVRRSRHKTVLALGAAILLGASHGLNAAAKPVLDRQSPPVTIDLWPGLAPGETTASTGRLFQDPAGRYGSIAKMDNITSPKILLYPAPNQDTTHPTVLIFPGGGYYALATDVEGSEVASWLNSLGYNAAILHYRIPDWRINAPERREPAFQDAQRAVSLLRGNAKTWNLDSHCIGIMGFSAGGHLAARLAASTGPRSDRPDFVLLIYPAYLWDKNTQTAAPEVQPHTGMPPMFLIQTRDDSLFDVESYAGALRQAGVPAECLIYNTGGHGYGLRLPSYLPAHEWPARAAAWMQKHQPKE